MSYTIGDMSEIREKILEQMRQQGLTIHAVAKLVEGRVPRRSVYTYLSAGKDTSSDRAAIIMKAVGLTVTRVKKTKKGKSR